MKKTRGKLETGLQALRESEARFRHLVEEGTDLLWETDKEGYFTYFSPNVRMILGYEPEELLGRRIMDFMPPAKSARIEKLMGELTSTRSSWSLIQHKLIHKSGEIRIMEASGNSILDADGQFL